MGSDKLPPRPAYVVDLDEDGKRVAGSRRSAKTNTKERPKVSQRESGRSDKPKNRRSANIDFDAAPERALARSGSRREEVITTENKERRKSSMSNTHSPQKERPSSAHKNYNVPKLHIPSYLTKEDPTYFGVPTPSSATRHVPTILSQPNMTQPIPMRPRPVSTQTYPPRPINYNATHTSTGAYGPPLSSSAWANYQPPAQSIITPSYPPPDPLGYMRYAATPAPQSSDYFGSQAMSAPERPMSARPLASRFDTPSGRTSSYGSRDFHQSDIDDAYSASYHDDGYTSVSDAVVQRRESIRVPSGVGQRLSKHAADYQAMPPPPRPSLRRPVTDYAPLPEPYEGRTLIRDDSRSRNRSSHRNSVSYHDGPGGVQVETANASRRRQSYYGQSATPSTGSSDYETKIRQASTYQQDVEQDVGETIPLTAEVLKRQQRRQAGSSRSTKSSASRDESDWRKSATTRTTRSGSGEGENVTIKVTGTARVMVGGAQIDCPDGGEIEIKQQQQQKALRNGSERSNSEYGGPRRIDDRRIDDRRIDDRRNDDRRIDDHRSRDERPSGPSRLISGNSHSRSKPQQYYGDEWF
ncbi:hypothetical protein LHYA1_G001119 [Lachnellula hyalina]|uniref:Uncharacterized protein n=1 Tax=Lachnellula hyalina TaxID=1316788 RepID=A0A8H8R7V3_9HELO|nr:uncharacterized protein LHYA1_G001119 [Lachnellula hyalina]TVY30150.1 hypothetical protein LHYA1_G001119 [Lachnellula hyalina]